MTMHQHCRIPGEFSQNPRPGVVGRIMIHKDIQVLTLRICECVRPRVRGVKFANKCTVANQLALKWGNHPRLSGWSQWNCNGP